MMTGHLLCMQTYQGLCILVTIALTSWCVYEYHLDKDVTNIVLRKFHESDDDIHPSITLCHKDPFEYYKKLTVIDPDERKANEIFLRYSSFILGYEYSKEYTSNTQELNDIDYDNITVQLEDVIKDVYIAYPFNLDSIYHSIFNTLGDSLVMNRNDSMKPKEVDWEDFQTFDHINTYISARHGNYKCFTFDVPLIKGKDIRRVGMRFQERSDGIDLGLFYFMLTYPNQTLQVSRGNQIELDKYLKIKPTCYRFEVFVGTMEVFRRRDKSKERCNEDWRQQDQKQLDEIINEVGCNPKSWIRLSEFPNCSTVEEYHKINLKYFEKDAFMPPCRSIESLSKITKGTDFDWRCDKKYLELIFYLDEERFYKEISLVPAYTFQSLIGNAGKIRACYLFNINQMCN